MGNYGYYRESSPERTLREVSTVAGSSEPVTLAEAKNWLRVDNNEDDTRITSLITTARRRAEAFLERDIVAKNREGYWTFVNEDINLPYTVDSVTSVTFEGVAQTVDEGYEVLGSNNSIIRIINGRADDVVIQYTTPSFTGDFVKNGVLMIIEEMYHQVETGWKRTLYPFKLFGHYGVQ